MMIKRFLSLAFVAFLPCITHADEMTDRIMAVKPPQNEAAHDRICGGLRSIVADSESRNEIASARLQPMLAMSIHQVMGQRIAAANEKEAELQCDTPFHGIAVQVQPPASKIDECIAACKANTGRTPSQCFDACNH